MILEDAVYDSLEEPSDDENDMLDLAFGLTDTWVAQLRPLRPAPQWRRPRPHRLRTRRGLLTSPSDSAAPVWDASAR